MGSRDKDWPAARLSDAARSYITVVSRYGRLSGALLTAATLAVLLTSCPSEPQEGSGSPFAHGSIQASIEGSDDIDLSQTIRDESGSVSATLTYTGDCQFAKADIRLSYEQGDNVVTDEEIGISPHVLGPLAPNQPSHVEYQGETTFEPDAIVFVVSGEHCV